MQHTSGHPPAPTQFEESTASRTAPPPWLMKAFELAVGSDGVERLYEHPGALSPDECAQFGRIVLKDRAGQELPADERAFLDLLDEYDGFEDSRNAYAQIAESIDKRDRDNREWLEASPTGAIVTEQFGGPNDGQVTVHYGKDYQPPAPVNPPAQANGNGTRRTAPRRREAHARRSRSSSTSSGSSDDGSDGDGPGEAGHHHHPTGASR